MIICTSGFYNPLHKGHLALFEEAAKLGELIVIVNTDAQVKIKGSVPFQDQAERLKIVQSIKYVTKAILAIDTDRTVIETLRELKPDIFVKGGDSTELNTPELEVCKELGIKVLFNVGGEKIQSSSWLKSYALKP